MKKQPPKQPTKPATRREGRINVLQLNNSYYSVSLDGGTPTRFHGLQRALAAATTLSREHAADIWIEDVESRRLFAKFKPGSRKATAQGQ